MKIRYLDTLNIIIEKILKDKTIKESIQNLKIKIRESEEPFVWSVINIDSFQQDLPTNIKSIWLFVLKKNTPSIAHYHPNSTQHTVMIEGKGKVKIRGCWKDLKLFNSSKRGIWHVIDESTPHEFFPQGKDMVVISFHTCLPKELIEIKCDSGEYHVYEK